MATADGGSAPERKESDRLKKRGWFAELVQRPEIGSFSVMVLILVTLAFLAGNSVFNPLGVKNNLAIIAQLGIITTGACLLMIAGEFDLSIGSMIGFTGMSIALMLKWGLPFGMGEATPFTAFMLTLIMALAIGWSIGFIVTRTGLSSFIVSLGYLFVLRGLTEVGFRYINDGSTQVSGLPDYKETSYVADAFGGVFLQPVFTFLYEIGWNVSRSGKLWVHGLDNRVFWWILITLVAYVILSRTQLGNWIYATGDNVESARANGVPVRKVKVGLFMFSAFCSTIFAACQVFETNSSDAAKGQLLELEAIATAVVGGTLMTGGFGTILGIVFGAVIFGFVKNAVFYIPWIDGAFYRVFLGTLLLVSTLFNEKIRKRITGGI